MEGNATGGRTLIVGLRHPLRRRILLRMRDAVPVSPRKLSIAFDHPISNVAYHMRVLVDCDAIILVSTRPSRGSTEHLYRTSDLPAWAWESIDRDSQ